MRPDYTLILPCKGEDCQLGETLANAAVGYGIPTHLIANCLYGDAIQKGIRRAKTEWIATMDTDGQHTWEDLQTVCGAQPDYRADMVIGQREGTWTPRGMASAALNLTTSILAGSRVPDMGSGVRIFRRAVALRLLPTLPTGFPFNASLTLGFLLKRQRVVWVAIPRRARTQGRSSVQLMDGVRTLQSLLKVRHACQHG